MYNPKQFTQKCVFQQGLISYLAEFCHSCDHFLVLKSDSNKVFFLLVSFFSIVSENIAY